MSSARRVAFNFQRWHNIKLNRCKIIRQRAAETEQLRRNKETRQITLMEMKRWMKIIKRWTLSRNGQSRRSMPALSVASYRTGFFVNQLFALIKSPALIVSFLFSTSSESSDVIRAFRTRGNILLQPSSSETFCDKTNVQWIYAEG